MLMTFTADIVHWKVMLFNITKADPSHIPYSVQGNQVAIKYIKNPGTRNFQKPSIIQEFTEVKCLVSFNISWYVFKIYPWS